MPENENENEVLDLENEEDEKAAAAADEKFRSQITGTLKGMQSKARLDGMKTMAQLILTVINSFEKKDGKKSCNDYKRLMKNIKRACTHALEDKDKDNAGEVDSDEQESENRN